MSRISEIAREMKTWWSDEGSDIEVQNALDEIIRLDDAEQTEPTISKMEQVDEPQSNADQRIQDVESVEPMQTERSE